MDRIELGKSSKQDEMRQAKRGVFSAALNFCPLGGVDFFFKMNSPGKKSTEQKIQCRIDLAPGFPVFGEEHQGGRGKSWAGFTS